VTADEAVIAVLDALAAAEVPYMIVGSLASNFHGIPRSTRAGYGDNAPSDQVHGKPVRL
jgi:hypothetical protein